MGRTSMSSFGLLVEEKQGSHAECLEQPKRLELLVC